jgi:hypothetical protein
MCVPDNKFFLSSVIDFYYYSKVDWQDNARDILQFLLHYLPPPSTSGQQQELPTLLPRQLLDDPSFDELDTIPRPRSPSKQNTPHTRRQWRGREIVGIGHSFGGYATAVAASALPSDTYHSIYSALALIDPVIYPPEMDTRQHLLHRVGAAIVRRDMWPSREDARTAFKRNKGFFGKWAPECLERYVQFGLVDRSVVAPGKGVDGVELKTRKADEAVRFFQSLSRTPHLYILFIFYFFLPARIRERRELPLVSTSLLPPLLPPSQSTTALCPPVLGFSVPRLGPRSARSPGALRYGDGRTWCGTFDRAGEAEGVGEGLGGVFGVGGGEKQEREEEGEVVILSGEKIFMKFLVVLCGDLSLSSSFLLRIRRQSSREVSQYRYITWYCIFSLSLEIQIRLSQAFFCFLIKALRASRQSGQHVRLPPSSV